MLKIPSGEAQDSAFFLPIERQPSQLPEVLGADVIHIAEYLERKEAEDIKTKSQEYAGNFSTLARELIDAQAAVIEANRIGDKEVLIDARRRVVDVMEAWHYHTTNWPSGLRLNFEFSEGEGRHVFDRRDHWQGTVSSFEANRAGILSPKELMVIDSRTGQYAKAKIATLRVSLAEE